MKHCLQYHDTTHAVFPFVNDLAPIAYFYMTISMAQDEQTLTSARVARPSESLCCYFFGKLTTRLLSWLVGWLVRSFVAWLVGWLAGCLGSASKYARSLIGTLFCDSARLLTAALFTLHFPSKGPHSTS